jgi:peptidoglycan/xylan/chitin deacetylase (PgdA/CDA1 family)
LNRDLKAFTLALLFTSLLSAAPLPTSWNGKNAAVSLTFDDGDISHTSIVIPALDAYGFKATFFIVGQDIPGYSAAVKTVWLNAASSGHELGDHSQTHANPTGLTADQLWTEVMSAKSMIETEFSTPVRSYATPYTVMTPALRTLLSTNFLVCRGGWGFDYNIPLTAEPDWMNIPSRGTTTAAPLSDYTGWIQYAIAHHSWIVFMIHGVGSTGYEPVPLSVFNGLLQYLDSVSDQVWVAPLGVVAAYYQDPSSIAPPPAIIRVSADWTGEQEHPVARVVWSATNITNTSPTFEILSGKISGVYSATDTVSGMAWERGIVPPGEALYLRILAFTNGARAAISPEILLPARSLQARVEIRGNIAGRGQETSSSEFRFMVPSDGTKVRIGIYTPAGELVRTLADTEFDTSFRTLTWGLDDDAGRSVPPGIYLAIIRIGPETFRRKIMVIR